MHLQVLAVLLLGVGEALGLSGFAQSSGNLLINGSLDDVQGSFVADGNQLMSLPAGSTAIPGWTVINGELAWGKNSNPFGPQTPDGTFFLDLTGYHDSPPYGGIAQTINTVPGRSYELSFSLGADQDNGAYAAPVAARVVVGSATNEFRMDVAAPPSGSLWQVFNIPYTATSDLTTITLEGAATAGGQYIGLDNVGFRRASGGADLLQNGSFEDVQAAFRGDGFGGNSLQPGASTIQGWTVTGGEIVWLPNTNSFGAKTPAGSYFLDLTGYHDAAPYGGVTQAVATTPGEHYNLSFAAGVDQDSGAYRGPVSIKATVGGLEGTYTFIPPGTGNQWKSFRYEFTAAGSSTEIQVSGALAGGGHYLGLDKLEVHAVVKISNVRAAGGNISFDVAQENYVVETTTDLGAGVWAPIAVTAVPHGDGIITLTAGNTSERERFFRVRFP